MIIVMTNGGGGGGGDHAFTGNPTQVHDELISRNVTSFGETCEGREPLVGIHLSCEKQTGRSARSLVVHGRRSNPLGIGPQAPGMLLMWAA